MPNKQRPRTRSSLGRPVTIGFLINRTPPPWKYAKPRWIAFCETLLEQGYTVFLYEAKTTVSKYITVRHAGLPGWQYRVRFSNHKPNATREIEGECDFFVGVTHTGVRNTDDALAALTANAQSATGPSATAPSATP